MALSKSPECASLDGNAIVKLLFLLDKLAKIAFFSDLTEPTHFTMV
jgi:hypothetical protein